MRSIKLMLSMCLIGMIGLTACTSEPEQTKEVKTQKTSFTSKTEEELESAEAIEAVFSEMEGKAYTGRVKINCIKIHLSDGGSPSQAHACVTVNGHLYDVTVWSDYMYHGDWYPSISHVSAMPTCGC